MQYPQPGYGPPPGPSYAQQPNPFQPPSQDREHLKILSICCYVYAGLVALGSLFGLIYVALRQSRHLTPKRLFLATSTNRNIFRFAYIRALAGRAIGV